MSHNLHHFMLEQLMDIYDAEQQAAKALPKMAKAVSSPDVKKAFLEHTEQTKRQVQRLEEIFSKLGERMESKECKGMQGLVAESEEYIQEEDMDPEIRDAALVGAEQKAEHYEIAAYTSAVELAELMEHKHAARLLRQILTEEERMSRKLTQISSRWLKKRYREEQRAERAAEAA
jgi:ferritin-like metal-binding protein YciE